MRKRMGLVLLLLAAAGCRSEADERADLTKAATESCVRGLEQRLAELPKGAPAGLDKQRFCECVTEKSFQGQDLQQLRKRREDRPGVREVEAMGACVMAEVRRTGAAPK